MIRVLFVCLGNICRSPMAEAIMRDLVEKEGLKDKIKVDSAGTGHWHVGERPHKGTIDILDKYKISHKDIVGRQMNSSHIEEHQYIIAMDADNQQQIYRLARENKGTYISRLMDFVPEDEREDVPDPYYTGNFEEVYEMISEGCKQLLSFVKERENL